jgi:hypothetical protein
MAGPWRGNGPLNVSFHRLFYSRIEVRRLHFRFKIRCRVSRPDFGRSLLARDRLLFMLLKVSLNVVSTVIVRSQNCGSIPRTKLQGVPKMAKSIVLPAII